MKLLFALLAVFALNAQAENIPLLSETCDHSFQLESTGFAFQSGGKTYVLASADFVLNSLTPSPLNICHSSGAQKLSLVRHDWSAGLALFESPQSSSDPFSPAEAKLLEEVSWAGATKKARIVSAKSSRHQFAGIEKVLELKSAAAVKTEVGSAVINSAGLVTGFISSQWIQEIPGSSSRVVRWLDVAQDTVRAPIALPAAFVQSWLAKAAPAADQLQIIANPLMQAKKDAGFQINNLVFIQDCPAFDSNGQDPNYPIGGADPLGIGGADPLGIGGAGGGPACQFKVMLANPTGIGSSTDANLESRRPWFTALEQKLNAGVVPTVKLGYFRYEGLLQPVALQSVGQLGQAILQPKVDFLLEYSSYPPITHESQKELIRASLQLQAEVRRPWGLISIRERSYLYGGLYLMRDYDTVTDNDLDVLYADALADQSSLMYIYQDVQAMHEARKALQK